MAGNTQLALMRIEFNKDGKFGECAHLLFFVALFTASSLLHGSIETSRLTFLYDSHITRRLDFKEMTSMNAQYPAILFPAFRMQNSMMNAVMGERWWLKKKGVRFLSPPPPSPTPTPAQRAWDACYLITIAARFALFLAWNRCLHSRWKRSGRETTRDAYVQA